LLKRLEELNWRTPNPDQVVQVSDTKVAKDNADRQTKLSA
jgi:hypothetical protein